MTDYALGSTDGEHERLIWQAERVAPLTERLFRAAGIGQGQRILDIGSGVGDVALQVARLVGPTGQVLGVERDARSIARARARVAEAGLHNVEFIQCDASSIPEGGPFDAAVGRFILMWVDDPIGVLRRVRKRVRPGGTMAFQEPYWVPLLHLLQPLPLWSAAASVIHGAFVRAGARPELGPALYQTYLDAGLPGPTMQLEMVVGRSPDLSQWFGDIVQTLRAENDLLDPRVAELGDFGTLRERLQAELMASKTIGGWPAYVGAWCQLPSMAAS